MLKAPFPLPAGFLAAFGYSGGRRFVALFWEPCGDEACYDDGVSYACGTPRPPGRPAPSCASSNFRAGRDRLAGRPFQRGQADEEGRSHVQAR